MTTRPRRATTVLVLALLLAGCSGQAGSIPSPGATDKATVPSAGPSTARTAAADVAAARDLLGTLAVGGRGPKTGYDRTARFGPAWVDVDGNGCDTRDDVLARDLTDAAKRGTCTVTAGRLADPYTGRTIAFSKSDASAVEIDHVVPLALAWQLGAAQWSQGERVTFANDPANLLAVDAASNQQKSASGPDSWLPPNKAYRCTYVIRFTRVAALYRLRITASMRDAISAQLDACMGVVGDPLTLTALPSSLYDRAARLGPTSG